MDRPVLLGNFCARGDAVNRSAVLVPDNDGQTESSYDPTRGLAKGVWS